MTRRLTLAVGLTLLMLTSGCLGLFGEEETPAEDPLGPAPELVMESPASFAHDDRVRLTGSASDDGSRISISGEVLGTSHFRFGSVDEAGVVSLDMGSLHPGTHEVVVTATDADDLSTTVTLQIVVNPAPSDPVAISALPAVIHAAEGEGVIARATVVHDELDTCSGTWTDDLGRSLGASVANGVATAVLGQMEQSFTGTITVTCGSFSQTSDTAEVQVLLLVDENPDGDGDGVPDASDGCVESSVVFDSNPSTDMDGDGCHDLSEDSDDDADGRQDGADLCARGLIGWDSTEVSLDHDGDGCQDASEDDDDDGDTILDVQDNCPLGPIPWQSTGASDYDRDGCRDDTEDLDDDEDGVLDVADGCATGVIGWTPSAEYDYDGDGCRDSDEDGDDDNDGVADFDDSCNRTLLGASVNMYGCAPYEWDEDGDGVTDDNDTCPGTPPGLAVNAQGCADLDGDGVFANVDLCPDSQPRWTADEDGCTVLQHPVDWTSTGASTERFGIVADFTVQTKFNGNWKMSRDWDGESAYLFIFNQDSNSYMSSLWSQNVGRLLDQMPANCHVFFGSFDSDYRNDIDSMNARVNSYRNQQSDDRKTWIDDHVHYIDQQGGTIGGGLGGVIGDWSAFYYGIDRFQQWREIGSLYNWANTYGVQYRLDYIGKMGQQFNAEFPTEMRRHDPGVTVVDIMVGHRHSGGWSGGHWSTETGTFPDAATMASFNTMEIYMHHGCSEHRDRYQKADQSYGGCHEWDYSQYLHICDEVGNSSTCGTEFGYWITTYGREGRWLTDISARLFELQEGGDRMFRYKGANGGWLNVSVYLSTWDDDGLRATDAELAFNGGSFRGEYNNESQYKRRHALTIPAGTERVEIYAVITGHGFGKDNANCAEFCNHEHRYSMNGQVTQEDHPMAGNGTVGSDNEGCAKTMGAGANANQLGSWPYGRAGWCAGQDVKPWVFDITDWVDWQGGANELLYRGLYNGQNYVPQNEQSGANQNIHANIWVVYYTNTSAAPAMDSGAQPPPEADESEETFIIDIVREEECAREE